jgi:peroxiredoxin
VKTRSLGQAVASTVDNMLTTSQPAPRFDTTCLSGDSLDLDDLRGRPVLVKFHRFSGCPVARHQIDQFVARLPELTGAGVQTIIVLHSSAEQVAPNFAEQPGLHIVADRDKTLYRAWACAFDRRRLLSPASWRATMAAFGRGYLPQPTRFQGGVVGIPADFLVDRDGVIAEAHYGRHFGDSWTVDDVLARLSTGTS